MSESARVGFLLKQSWGGIGNRVETMGHSEQARVDPGFYEKRGCFAHVLASAAKLAHAHYRQASRARSWPVPNLQVVGMTMYTYRMLAAYLPTYRENFSWAFYSFSFIYNL